MTIGQIATRSAYIPTPPPAKPPTPVTWSSSKTSTPATSVSVSLQAAAAYYAAKATVDDPTKRLQLTSHSPNLFLVSNSTPLPHTADSLLPASLRGTGASSQASSWATSMSPRFTIKAQP